jgi:CheY-like chemotaxis protein
MAQRFKILVVEQDPPTLRQIESTLKVMGAEPRCLTSSREAAKLINEEKFDGAFLDWDTPELSGEDLTKLIRHSKSNKTIPIAMLTASTNAKAIAAGFKVGVTFFLSKPVGGKELARLLNVARGAMLEERRRYQRVPVRVAVQCKWGGKEHTGQVANISLSGILLTVPNPPEVGAEIALAFTLPKAHNPFHLRAAVVRVAPGNQVGLKFLGVPAEEHEQLKKFLAHAGSSSSFGD